MTGFEHWLGFLGILWVLWYWGLRAYRLLKGGDMLTEQERDEVKEIISDYFAMQAAACTTQADCPCGRSDEEHRELRGERG